MYKATEFEFSSKGLRLSQAVLDWQTGEILIERRQWYEPTQEDHERFTSLVAHDEGAAYHAEWSQQLFADLKMAVSLMAEWFKKWGKKEVS